MLRLVKKTKPSVLKKPELRPTKAKVKEKTKTKTVMKTVQQAKPKAQAKPKRERKPKVVIVPAPAPVPTEYPSGLPIVSPEERKSARIEAHVRLLSNLHFAKVYLKTAQKEIALYRADKRAKEVKEDEFQALANRFSELEQLHRRKLEKARAMNTDEGVKNEKIEVKKPIGNVSARIQAKTGHREGGNKVRIEEKPKVRQGEGKKPEGVKRFLKRRG